MSADTKAGETAKGEDDNVANHIRRSVRQHKDCNSEKYERTKGWPKFNAPIKCPEFSNTKACQGMTGSLSLSGCWRLKMPYTLSAIPGRALAYSSRWGEWRPRVWG